jgi:hypothetical protein
MKARRFWVENGKIGQHVAQSNAIGPIDERVMFKQGQVRVTSGKQGTEIKWVVLSPCNASLFATTVIIKDATAPFVLRFFASGWFEEFYGSVADATRRIELIIARGDRHFTCHTLVREHDIKKSKLSNLLETCLENTTLATDYAVECVYENSSNQFHVEKIGAQSPIARVYGTFLSSFPCRAQGQYSTIVSEAYSDVLNTGKPKYHHVLAAMRMPNNDVVWVPYCRLVIPQVAQNNKNSVLVISEISPVEIQLI